MSLFKLLFGTNKIFLGPDRRNSNKSYAGKDASSDDARSMMSFNEMLKREGIEVVMIRIIIRIT